MITYNQSGGPTLKKMGLGKKSLGLNLWPCQNGKLNNIKQISQTLGLPHIN